MHQLLVQPATQSCYVMLCTRVQRLVTEHMQVPFSVTQGRYLLAQVLAYIQSLTAVPLYYRVIRYMQVLLLWHSIN